MFTRRQLAPRTGPSIAGLRPATLPGAGDVLVAFAGVGAADQPARSRIRNARSLLRNNIHLG